MHIADINLEIRALCDADSISYPAAALLRRVNNAYEKIIGRIMCQDGNWEFDDTNYSDFPRAKTTMVASQHDYSFDTSHLAIESAHVLDADGIWHELVPISKDRMGCPPEEFQKTDGLPYYYDKDGKSILLYPAPAAASVTLVDGLQVHFRRTADLFTSGQVTTGTKVPGFASPFHMLLVYEAAIPFCNTYKPERVPYMKIEARELWKDMLAFYAHRAKDERNRMSMGGIRHR